MPASVGDDLSEAYAYCQILQPIKPLMQSPEDPISVNTSLLKPLPRRRRRSPTRNPVKSPVEMCANHITADEFLLQDPDTETKNTVFWKALAEFCFRTGIEQCQKCENSGKAPKCDSWPQFREWAVVCMSCEAFRGVPISKASISKRSISKASIYIASVVSGCCFILEKYLADDALVCDDEAGRHIDLHEVTNVIYWMATSMGKRGAGPSLSWDHRTIPSWITIPATNSALVKADSLPLCKNRLWNLAKLSDRGHYDIPEFVNAIEDVNDKKAQRAFRHVKHDLCSPTKCQEAHQNVTNVKQLHKCEKGHHKACVMVKFPMEVLENALDSGKSTAWHLEDRRPCTKEESYMAISHVWADGTGVGGGRSAGTVNQCLLGYFSKIARDRSCVGIWWDTISVPERSPARGLALQNMHNYYRRAEFTVVHDSYLLKIPWREDGSPCIAMVLSAWFTRGWTALELLVSPTVKVIFQDDQIKDLDSEILAKDPASSTRGHWMATQMIQRLRRPVKDLDDLLAILSPRHTSWMRDRTTIAALLVDLPDFDPNDAESIMTQRIVSHLGNVAHAHLLHGKSTATKTGSFSWLPSTLDDIPVNFPGDLTGITSSSALLKVSTNGVVEGSWFCRCVTTLDVKENRVRPWGLDSAVQFKVDAALLEWENCLLLSPTEKFKDRVLLAYSCGTDGALECQYIATIVSHDLWAAESTCEKRLVRIGGNVGDHIRARRAVKNTSNPHPDQQRKRLPLSLQERPEEKLRPREPVNHGKLKVESSFRNISKPLETHLLPKPSGDSLQSALERNNRKAVAWILKMGNWTYASKKKNKPEQDLHIKCLDDVVRELVNLKPDPVKPNPAKQKYLEDLLDIYVAIDPTETGKGNLLPSLQLSYLLRMDQESPWVSAGAQAPSFQDIWERLKKSGQFNSNSDPWCLLKYNVLASSLLRLLSVGESETASRTFWEGLGQFYPSSDNAMSVNLERDMGFPWHWNDRQRTEGDGELEKILRAALRKFVMIYRGERPAIIPITSLSLGILLSCRRQEDQRNESEQIFRSVQDDFKALGLEGEFLDMVSRFFSVKMRLRRMPREEIPLATLRDIKDELLKIRLARLGSSTSLMKDMKKDVRNFQKEERLGYD